MGSNIDPTKPIESVENPDGTWSHPTTESVRKNFSAAAVEIIALQVANDSLSSDVVLNTAHRARTDNPHSVNEAQVGVLIRALDGDIFTATANTLTLVPGGHLREHYFNGMILEKSTMTVAESAGVVTVTVGAETGSTLRYFFSDYDGQVTGLPDSSIDSTGELTLGTATVPVKNYIYLLQSDKTFHAGVAWPMAEHAPIGTVTIQDAASIAVNGAISLQLWHDEAVNGNELGHFGHITKWIRAQHSTWISGIACSITVGAQTYDIATTSGRMRQLHEHDYPSFDTSATGTAGVIYIVNDNTTPFVKKTDGLSYGGVPEYSDGSNVSNNDRYSVVFWGIVSETTGTCKLLANLPSGGYATDADARADTQNKTDFTIPAGYVGVGFLIARGIVKFQSAGGGTFTLIECEDLRGLLPGALGGGGSGSTPTEFDESVFRITDTIDNTKKIAFEADDLTTGTVREINMPDSDVDLGGLVGTKTIDNNLVMGDTYGIDFSANTDVASGSPTSAVFNNYKEGIWTPEIWDAASGGNEVGAYSDRQGSYTRTGRTCHLYGYVNVATMAPATGANDVFVRGLPFPGKINSGNIFQLMPVSSNATYSGTLHIGVGSNGAYMKVLETISGSPFDHLTLTELGAGYLFFNGSYQIA